MSKKAVGKVVEPLTAKGVCEAVEANRAQERAQLIEAIEGSMVRQGGKVVVSMTEYFENSVKTTTSFRAPHFFNEYRQMDFVEFAIMLHGLGYSVSLNHSFKQFEPIGRYERKPRYKWFPFIADDEVYVDVRSTTTWKNCYNITITACCAK